MADASKLKRLGAPPAIDEARDDLSIEEPPVAAPIPPALPPAPPATEPSRYMEEKRSSIPWRSPPPPMPEDYNRIDGRTLRRSGRTVQLSTRVSHDFDNRLRRLAAERNLLIVEILELALDSLEESITKSSR